MNIPPELKTNGNVTITTPSGAKATLPLCHINFQKWTGKLPDFDFGGKPLIDYQGNAIFAEFAILNLLKESGWDGVWVETYGGIHFLKDMPGGWKLAKNSVSIPTEKEVLLRNILKMAKTTACFDVFAWKNDEIIFCESKHKGKDRLTKAQTRFIEGALSYGISKKALIIVEWEYFLAG